MTTNADEMGLFSKMMQVAVHNSTEEKTLMCEMAAESTQFGTPFESDAVRYHVES